jgi:hypothetical protein
MDKRIARAAYNIVTQAKDSVPDIALYRELCDITGVGDIFGKTIKFTSHCRVKLERVCDRELGKPLLSLGLNEADRGGSSVKNPCDKWATEGVFANLINFTTLGEWPIKGNNQLPNGFIASCLGDELDFSNVEAVVLVENGEVLTKWAKTVKIMPTAFKNAVAIYRGHGHNINLTRDLIKSLNIPVGLYFDFDASGLEMATLYMNNPNHQLIIPNESSENLHKMSKRKEFDKQYEALYRGLRAKNSLLPLFEQIKNFELAVMQERMAEEGTQLRIYDV